MYIICGPTTESRASFNGRVRDSALNSRSKGGGSNGRCGVAIISGRKFPPSAEKVSRAYGNRKRTISGVPTLRRLFVALMTILILHRAETHPRRVIIIAIAAVVVVVVISRGR